MIVNNIMIQNGTRLHLKKVFVLIIRSRTQDMNSCNTELNVFFYGLFSIPTNSLH
jgi:hypothetical protein